MKWDVVPPLDHFSSLNIPVGQICQVCWMMCPLRVFKLIPFTWKDIQCCRILIYWNWFQSRPPDGWNGPAALTSIPLWPNDFETEMLSTLCAQVCARMNIWSSSVIFISALLSGSGAFWCHLHTACFVLEFPTAKVLQNYEFKRRELRGKSICHKDATARWFGKVLNVNLDFVQPKYKTKLKEEPVFNGWEIAHYSQRYEHLFQLWSLNFSVVDSNNEQR